MTEFKKVERRYGLNCIDYSHNLIRQPEGGLYKVPEPVGLVVFYICYAAVITTHDLKAHSRIQILNTVATSCFLISESHAHEEYGQNLDIGCPDKERNLSLVFGMRAKVNMYSPDTTLPPPYSGQERFW
jgi:hypothetical protein